MNTLTGALRDIVQRQLVLPDADQCGKCGYWTVTEAVIATVAMTYSDDEAGFTKALGQAACKCAERQAQKESLNLQRWADSNLPHQRQGQPPRTFQNFDWEVRGAETAYRAARAFSERPDHILVLRSDVGRGKTHLMEAIGRVWLDGGGTVRYDHVPDLLDELRPHEGSEGAATVLGDRYGAGVLLLDDMGVGGEVKAASPFVQESLTKLVDERYRNGGALVVATNLTHEEMQHSLGFRIASRLWDERGPVKRVWLTGEDMRSKGAS